MRKLAVVLLLATVGLGFYILIRLLRNLRPNSGVSPNLSGARLILISCICFVAGSSVLNLLDIYALGVGSAVAGFLQHRYAQVILAVAVFSLGWLAYKFKQTNIYVYGVCEVAFGTISTMQIALGMKLGEAMFARWAALVGAVYVVSRGFNNMEEGKKKRDIGSGGG